MQSTFLRHEYFGGILYTQEIPGPIPILEPEWSLISGAVDPAGAEKLRTEAGRQHAAMLRKHVEDCVRYGVLGSDFRLTCEVFQQSYPLVRGILSAPVRVYLHITERCNLSCRHCMFACGRDMPKGHEMTFEEIQRLLRILHDVRCPELRITGGEPTVRKDVPCIMAEAKQMGFYTMLNTNGSFTAEVGNQIAQAEPDELIFSLDGPPERHEQLRGKGSFSHLEQNMRFFSRLKAESKRRILLALNFTFGKHNVQDLDWVVFYAARLGINVNLMPLRPYGAARCDLPEEMLSPEEFLRFTESVCRLRERSEIRDSGIRIIHKNFDLKSPAPDGRGAPSPFDRSSCGAGSFGLGVNPDGHINVCGFLAKDDRFIGPSMLEMPFERVWYGPTIHGFRCIVKVDCEGCRFYRRSCVGACKAMALAHGDGQWDTLSGRDPYCYAHLLEQES